MNRVFIGIDGGGTHSTAVAYDERLRERARAEGGGLNFHNDGKAVCKARLAQLVEALLQKSGAEEAFVCAGLSALDARGEEALTEAFRSALPPQVSLLLESDARIALAAHTGENPGMAVICGTGSMVLYLDKSGAQHALGGWGYKLHDALSGYTLSVRAMSRALDAFDAGDAAGNALLDAARTFFDVPAENSRTLIDVLYAPESTPKALAAFAKDVLFLAEAGDGLAREIVETECGRMARLMAAARARAPEITEAGLYGGVLTHSRFARETLLCRVQALSPDLRPALLRHEPAYGAALLAKNHYFSRQTG